MRILLPWECKNCGHKWTDDLFSTWSDCPNCESECIGHGLVKELCALCDNESRQELLLCEECTNKHQHKKNI